MKATIFPSFIKGIVTAPASKSDMQRACAAALLRGGKTVLHNPGISADDTAALHIIEQLGCICKPEDDKVSIISTGIVPVANTIHCGESGLSVRMFTSIAALHDKEITVTGGGSLLKRPLHFFDEALPQLGVTVESAKGHLPLKIKGPLHPKNIIIDGSLSSQFLTGLLFAYAASGVTDVTIRVTNLNSKPYVDLTLAVLKSFGLNVPVNKEYQEFYFDSSSIKKVNDAIFNYTVEGDWSNAAFILVAGAVAGDITLQGMKAESLQGDKKILEVLGKAGANISITDSSIHIQESHLSAFHFDATHCPDLFPPLVALASCCNGASTIKGVQRLTHKESNRAQSLQQEFTKMGVPVFINDDVMTITGVQIINSATVSSHNDHRIAMACAVVALKSNGQTIIEEAQAVNKSYPNFWQHLQQLSAPLSLTDN